MAHFLLITFLRKENDSCTMRRNRFNCFEISDLHGCSGIEFVRSFFHEFSRFNICLRLDKFALCESSFSCSRRKCNLQITTEQDILHQNIFNIDAPIFTVKVDFLSEIFTDRLTLFKKILQCVLSTDVFQHRVCQLFNGFSVSLDSENSYLSIDDLKVYCSIDSHNDIVLCENRLFLQINNLKTYVYVNKFISARVNVDQARRSAFHILAESSNQSN